MADGLQVLVPPDAKQAQRRGRAGRAASTASCAASWPAIRAASSTPAAKPRSSPSSATPSSTAAATDSSDAADRRRTAVQRSRTTFWTRSSWPLSSRPQVPRSHSRTSIVTLVQNCSPVSARERVETLL